MSAVPKPGVDELLAAAENAARATDWSRAADLLSDAPDQVRVLDKQAFYLSRAKRYEEARAVLAVLRGREPGNFLWPHMTGYQYYEEGRYEEAIPWLLQAYKLNPTHLRNLYRLAQSRRHQGDSYVPSPPPPRC
jgi:predicted Zn-dependent protease